MNFKLSTLLALVTVLTACASSTNEKGDLLSPAAQAKSVLEQQKNQPATLWYAKQFDLGIRFKAPSLRKTKEIDDIKRYYFMAQRGRFTVSLNVAAPNCKSDHGEDAHYQCLLSNILRNPHQEVKRETISKTPHKNGTSLTYISLVKMGEQQVKVINNHVIFSNNGVWGDLHASMLHPTHYEFLMMLAFSSYAEVINKKADK